MYANGLDVELLALHRFSKNFITFVENKWIRRYGQTKNLKLSNYSNVRERFEQNIYLLLYGRGWSSI